VPGPARTSRRSERLWSAAAALGVPALIVGGAVASASQPSAATVVAAHVAATIGGTPPITVIIHEPTGVTTGPVPQVPTPGTPAPAPPPPPPSGTKPPPKPKPKAKRPTATQVVKLPSASRCVSSLHVVLARPDGVHLHALSVQLGGGQVARTPAPSSITFHQLPKHHFTLRVTVTTSTGSHLSRTRQYRPCA
jgi:hypothetical protein